MSHGPAHPRGMWGRGIAHTRGRRYADYTCRSSRSSGAGLPTCPHPPLGISRPHLTLGISRPAQGPPHLEIRIWRSASRASPVRPARSTPLDANCSGRADGQAAECRRVPVCPACDRSENSGVEHRGFRSCVAHLPGGICAARPWGIGRNHGAVHANTTPALASVSPRAAPLKARRLTGVSVRDLLLYVISRLARRRPSRLCGPHV